MSIAPFTIPHASTAAQAWRSNVRGLSVSSGLDVLEEEMAAFRAACFLTLSGVQQVGVCIDGTRFGRPARDYTAGFISDPVADNHLVLTPSVPRGPNHH